MAEIIEVEVWKDVVGYEGLYEVSNLGRVKSIARNGTAGGLMSLNINRSGYIYVGLRKSNVQKYQLVHRLVGLAFIPLVDGKEMINHKDGNKTNNNLGNLEWVNNSENRKHAYANNLQKVNLDKAHEAAWENQKRKVKQFSLDGKIVAEFNSIQEAAITNGIGNTCISQCLSGRYKQSGGFMWKYSEDVNGDNINPLVETNTENSESGIKYIARDRNRNKWIVKVGKKYLGKFERIEDAIEAKEKYMQGIVVDYKVSENDISAGVRSGGFGSTGI